MNMNRLVNMVVRLFTLRLLQKGINRGMRKAGGSGGKGAKGSGAATPAQRSQQTQARAAAKRARQAAQITRRLGR